MYILATALQDTIWLVLLIVFGFSIYAWSKGNIANKTVAVLITLILVYLIFIRFTELVWIVAIVVVAWWIWSSDIKKWIKDNVKV